MQVTIEDPSTPVVVLKAEHYGSLGIFRSLGRLGVMVYGIDRDPRAPGLRSRYCRRAFVWDADGSDQNATLEFLLRVGLSIGRKSILIPTSDETALFAAQYSGRLSRWFLITLTDLALGRSLCSKKEMYYKARSLGIPAPKTEFPRSRSDVAEYARTALFPVMLKGIDGRRLEQRTGKKMVIARSERELLGLYDRMEESAEPNLMLQEYIPGGDDSVWMFNGYFNADSECLAGFTGRKLRQNPVYTGMTSLGICERNDAVLETTKRFMKAIGYRGILDIGYRYDARDGLHKVLDVNPRIGASFRLFTGSNGLDVVRAMYLDLTGQKIHGSAAPEGRKWFVEDKDLNSSYRYFRDGTLRFRDWLVSYNGVREAAYFAADDILPFMRMIANHIMRKIRQVRALVRRRPAQEHVSPPEGVRPLVSVPEDLSHRPPAVVLSFGGSAEAYDIVRSLGMDGIPAVVASSQHHNIAFYSRNCRGRILLPEFDAQSAPLIVEKLRRFSDGYKTSPVLFYVSDPELSFVREYRQQLAPYFSFLMPSEETLDHLFNKVLFNTYAREHQFPVPETITAGSAGELRSISSSIPFPCIVKPAFSQDWVWDNDHQREVFGPYKSALRRFTGPEELLAFCRNLPERASGFLVQSYVDGRDEGILSFHGYFDERSECLASFLGRKIRTYPPHTGGSVYVRTIHNPELCRRSIGYLQRIGFKGIVKIDYKWSHAANRFMMLEINPRYNLWELLGAYAGVNLAAVAYRHQIHEAVAQQHDYRDGVRLLFLKQDLRAFLLGYRKTGEWTLGSYIKSLAASTRFRVLVPSDPLPFVVSVAGFLRRRLIPPKRLSTETRRSLTSLTAIPRPSGNGHDEGNHGHGSEKAAEEERAMKVNTHAR
jgi:predicted ATP-grasp superfamily ATP-dependent carboligase